MIFSEIRRCKTKGALEVVPADPVALDLDEAERALTQAGFSVVNAAVLLVASRADVVETSLFEDGKLLVKTLDPRAALRSAALVFAGATGLADGASFEEYQAAGASKV